MDVKTFDYVVATDYETGEVRRVEERFLESGVVDNPVVKELQRLMPNAEIEFVGCTYPLPSSENLYD